MHRHALTTVLLLSACALIGCELATPRPTNAGFIEWLVGQRVTSAPGIIFNDVWLIEGGELSEFQVHKITTNPAIQTYAATVSFRATASGKGIQVSEAVIRYKHAEKLGKLQFVEFIVVAVSKIGA